jgi:hypothetical protein
VPFLNLWRPKQIANDIWRASDPGAPRDQGTTWYGDSVPKLYLVWWLGWLVMGQFYWTGSRLIIRADEISELQNANGVLMIGDSLSIVTAALALLVVRRTTARQTERAVRLGLAPQEDPRPVWRRASAWAVLLAALAAFGLQGLISIAGWTGNLDPSGEAASTPHSPRSAPPDALFADDFSNEGVWLVKDDSSVETGYVEGRYHILVREAKELWYTTSPLPHEADAISLEVETVFDAGRVKTDYYGLGCIGSSEENYLFGISPDGYHTISFVAGNDPNVKRLVENAGNRRFSADHAKNRLRAECVRQGDTVALKLAVNGNPVTQAIRRRDPGKLIGVELFAYSQNGDTDVRFDNLIVREKTSR